jgi:hypothetical protein
MNEPTGDPVPAIGEAEAEGDIARIYDDIRATLGVPVVNLIWRHLAARPGALDWAWGSIRPAYVDGTITAHAAALRARLVVPRLHGFTPASLAASGLSPADLARIDMIERSYERSNAMNMVALSALICRLDGALADADVAAADEAEAIRAGRRPDEPVGGEMPALLPPDAIAPELATLIADLNAIGGRDDIKATMYRHLAHWPAYLALIEALLAPFEASGGLEPLIRVAIGEGRRRGQSIAAGLAVAPPPPAGTREAIDTFIDGPIGKMIAIVALLRRARPGTP